MKKPLALLAVIALLLLLPACGGGVSDFKPADLSTELLSSKCFTDLLSEMDKDVALELYGIDSAKVESCAVYLGTGATAEEIAVFKAKDEAAAGDIETALKTRVSAQIEAYKNYVPTEVPKLEKAIILKKGVYAVYVTADNAEAARAILDKYIDN